MASWVCKRCETANGAEARTCEVCGSLMLYTHEEVEQLLAQRVAAVRAEVAAAIKPSPPPIPSLPPPPAASRNPDDGWLLAIVLLIVLLGVLYTAIFMPVEWNEFRIRVILAYNELLLQLPR